MRRAARWLLTLCSAVSLALLLASCVFWARSRWYYDSYVRWTPTGAHHGELLTRAISSGNGTLYAIWMREGVMVRELQHGNWPGPIPLLEPREKSSWESGLARSPNIDYGFDAGRRTVRTTMLEALGLHIIRRNSPSSTDGRWEAGWELTVPFWMLAVVFAALPASHAVVFLRRARRRRRAAKGCCARCGYDLRETPERCPECGTVAAAPRMATSSVP